MFDDKMNKGIHEECGVFGVFGVKNAANLTYYGLHNLQHRGQEGCGIVSAVDGKLSRVRGGGLVTEVFNQAKLDKLAGSMAIGHVRYSSAGNGGEENIQPLLFHHSTGDFAMAHNGNIVNATALRLALEARGSLFQTSSDTEVLAHLIKKDGADEHRIFPLLSALEQLDGAFAILIMTPKRIYACRDKYGMRPLSLGRMKNNPEAYVVASETCAFDAVGAEYLRDVEPGEVVTIDHHGLRSNFYTDKCQRKMCAMEFIYFARPDSDIEGCNVHAYRKESGRLLWKEAPADADLVVGVPDSSLSAAIGYSEASGLPYEMGMIKSKYVARTFIQPSQEMREKGVKMKLSVVHSIVKDKRVVLVDDSIVRGTTSRNLVQMLRDAGAKEVHMRIASPPYCHPCYYGVDTGTYEELVAASKSVEEIREMIGADSLAYLSAESLLTAGHRSDLCAACFTGKYPTDLYKDVKAESREDVE